MVTLAGIKSSDTTNTSGYTIIVAGGPIYAGTPTTSVKDFLNTIKSTQTTRIGVFRSGSGETAPEDIAQSKDTIAALPNANALSNAIIMKIGTSENLDLPVNDLTEQLVQ
jgi:hypothetical protein